MVRTTEIGDVVVHVADDGTGLAGFTEPGLGLKGMRERVQALGGTLQLGAGQNGKGLVVAAKLPCTAAMEEV